MPIELKCYATLDKYQPPNADAFPLTPGETLGQLVERLGIPPADVTLRFVNGKAMEPEHVLADGDRVGLFPPVGGG